MHAGMASDEVTDAIAHIEMHRQETQKESGLAASCSEALRKLHALLEQERTAQQAHGPGSGNPANIEAVMAEIRRITKLAGSANRGASSRHARRGPQPPATHRPHNQPRHKGRRRTGRHGGDR